MSFSERLKELIKERNLSQSRFADETGITRARLNNYIKGRSEPGYDILIKIAQSLNVSIDYLLGCEMPSPLHTWTTKRQAGIYYWRAPSCGKRRQLDTPIYLFTKSDQ